MKTKLIFSVSLIDNEQDVLLEKAKEICSSFKEIAKNENIEDVKVALVREGDRSALNILLPKIEGRFGEHYQSRKASLDEVC